MRRKNSIRYPVGTFRSEIFFFNEMLDIQWKQTYDGDDGASVEDITSNDPFTKHFLETRTDLEMNNLALKLFERSQAIREAEEDAEVNEQIGRRKGK